MNKRLALAMAGGAGALAIAFAVFGTGGLEGIANVGENEGENGSLTEAENTFPLVQKINLPNVSGRIDHMDIDTAGGRLFVAEIENNSVDVIDLKTGQRIHAIGGLSEPQGVIFVPESRRLFVSNGGDGTVQVFNSDTFGLVKTVNLSSDADNMHYDPMQKIVYVGYGNGAIGMMDAINGTLLGSIELGGHPESFQVSDELSKIFVNVPEDDSIAVIDLQKRSITDRWQNGGAHGNYPMALNEDSGTLFVGYREPPQLYVMDTNSGKTITKLDIAKDPDDVFYDKARKQIYISAGDGFVYVISNTGDPKYNVVSKIPTGLGARTSLFVPLLNELFVAVPDYGGQQAQIDVFQVSKMQ